MEEEKERDRDTDGETSFLDALIGEEEQNGKKKTNKRNKEQVPKRITPDN